MNDDKIPPAHELLLRHPSTIEWWDIPLLPAETKTVISAHEKTLDRLFLLKQNLPVAECDIDRNQAVDVLQLTNSSTYKLVQHPVPIKPLGYDPKSARPPTVYLTEKERKRARRLKRAAALQEVRDKQALGIIPAPEIKLTMSNYMKVIGDSAVLDPSKMEAMVRKQVAGRLQKHLDGNESRKLTKDEKKAKLERKLYEDTEKTGVAIATFYVADLGHRYHRTKLDLFCQQNSLSGSAVTDSTTGGTVVIVEGGPKAMRRMERFMNVRMKWKGEGLDEVSRVEDDDEDGEGRDLHKFNPDNYCTHLWSGMAVQRKYVAFKFEEEHGVENCKRLMDKGGNGLGYFWDQVGTGGVGLAGGGGGGGGWESDEDDADAMQE
jgi:U4/U6 small nuclear ribonucleoprotein PRP3